MCVNSPASLLSLLNVIFAYLPTKCLYQFTDSLNHVWLNETIAEYNVNLDLFPMYNSKYIDYLLNHTNSCPGMLITTQNATQIEEALHRLWYTSGSRMYDMKLIIVSGANNTNILKSYMVLNFANVLLLNAHEEFVYCFTHKFVGGVGHNVNETKEEFLVNTWDTKKERFLLDDVQLFPDKLNPGWKKTWVVGSDYAPIHFNLVTNSGSHLNALYEYAKVRNINLVHYKFTPGVLATGERCVNFTRDEITDVAISALFLTLKRYKEAGTRSTLSGFAITCLVPVIRPAYGWMQYVQIFSAQIWFAFLVLNALVYLILFKLIKTKLPLWLIIIGIMLQQPIMTCRLRDLKLWTLKLVVLAQLMAMCYCSNLSSMIIVPMKGSEISTVEDLANADTLWYTDDPGVLAPILNDLTPRYQNLLKKVRVIERDILEAKTATAEIIVVAQRSRSSAAVTIDNNVTIDTLRQYKILKDNILASHATIYLHRHSQHLNDFWRFVSKLKASGLVDHWETLDIGEVIKVEKYLSKGDAHQSHSHRALTMEHMKGIFALWLIATAIAMVIFTAEVVSHGKTTQTQRDINYA